MAVEKIYKFRGIEHLHADAKGNFFFDNKPVHKIYHVGNSNGINLRLGWIKQNPVL